MVQWPHSPVHIFNSTGSYMVTGATLQKQFLFNTSQQLDLLQRALFRLALQYDWRLEAWAIFPNHYHFIAQSPTDPSILQRMLTHLHAHTARELNQLEGISGRKVWYQYWETQLTFEKSYLARLNYVMNNPVKHKVVQTAQEYPWCSAGWFRHHATPAHHKVVSSFKIDSVKVMDDF